MKASTKRFLSFAFLILTFVIVIYIGFKGNDPNQVFEVLRSLKPIWLLAFFACWLCYMLCETLSLYVFLKQQDVKISFFSLIKIAIIGNYYSNITPASTGGQPIQVYYLKKLNVPIGIGSSILTVKFFIFQLSVLSIASFFWIFNSQFVYERLQGRMWILYLGYFFNSISVVGVFALAINKRLVNFLSRSIIKLLHFLKIVKNKELAMHKVNKVFDSFSESVNMIRKNAMHLLVQYIITICQMLCMYSITVCLYWAFGKEGYSVFDIFTLVSLLYIGAAYTPLPGASGAQEGGFALFFRGIFPNAALFSALIIWRFFTYYLTLLAGILVSIKMFFKSKKSSI